MPNLFKTAVLASNAGLTFMLAREQLWQGNMVGFTVFGYACITACTFFGVMVNVESNAR